MRIFTFALLTALPMVGCIRSTAVAPGAGTGNGSGLSDVTVNLPEKIKGKENLLTGFQLIVEPATPAEANCVAPTQANEIGEWDTVATSTPTPSPTPTPNTQTNATKGTKVSSKKVSVKRGCSYIFSLRLGKLSADKKKLEEAYFSNYKEDATQTVYGSKLLASDIGEKDTVSLKLVLDITKAGIKAGFGDNSATVETPKDVTVDIKAVLNTNQQSAADAALQAKVTEFDRAFGLKLSIKPDGTIAVSEVANNSPAQIAGFVVGMTVAAVDGKSVKDANGAFPSMWAQALTRLVKARETDPEMVLPVEVQTSDAKKLTLYIR